MALGIVGGPVVLLCVLGAIIGLCEALRGLSLMEREVLSSVYWYYWLSRPGWLFLTSGGIAFAVSGALFALLRQAKAGSLAMNCAVRAMMVVGIVAMWLSAFLSIGVRWFIEDGRVERLLGEHPVSWLAVEVLLPAVVAAMGWLALGEIRGARCVLGTIGAGSLLCLAGLLLVNPVVMLWSLGRAGWLPAGSYPHAVYVLPAERHLAYLMLAPLGAVPFVARRRARA